MEIYSKLKSNYEKQFLKLNTQHKIVGLFRFLLVLLVFYLVYLVVYKQSLLLIFLLTSAVFIFVFLLKLHQKITWKRSLNKTLAEINQQELDFLLHQKKPFADGSEFKIVPHPFANDLDIFGANSLFQYLNRTATFIGKKHLSNSLLQVKSPDKIIESQQGIKELAQKIDFRQSIFALGKLSLDSKEAYEKLLFWLNKESEKNSLLTRIFSFVNPVLLLLFFGIYIFSGLILFGKLSLILFLVNLFVLILQLKNIQNHINKADEIYSIVHQYSLLLDVIENEKFVSKELKDLQAELLLNGQKSSKTIHQLSRLFSSMESLHNLFGAVLFNGFFLYHLHTFNKLLKWKKANALQVIQCLEVMGKIEALNSLANFSFNHPEYVFPELNHNFQQKFTDLGHPLIVAEKRVNNSVAFENQKLIILSGSNMSGKSTFLRSLGINLLLGGIGAPVCATSSNIHPLNIWVSMRLSDSLNDDTSYFFAEVKRLKEIMDSLSEKPCFILLDEILRGTNSEDKRNGTIAVIQKIKKLNGIGVIATHDLEVCELEKSYPTEIVNFCFESEIIEQKLHFDYQLKKGICQNKNATFILQSEGII